MSDSPPNEALGTPPAEPLPPTSESSGSPRSAMLPLTTWLATVGGWLVPGLGHLILSRWGRAAAIFICVGGLTVAGYKLGGQVFSIHTGDIYSILGHVAEAGTGVFYFLWPVLEPAGADIARAAGDIGTRLLAIAGLLNFLCVIDAFEIARRAKQ